MKLRITGMYKGLIVKLFILILWLVKVFEYLSEELVMGGRDPFIIYYLYGDNDQKPLW